MKPAYVVIDDFGIYPFSHVENLVSLKKIEPDFKVTLMTVPNWSGMGHLNENKEYMNWITKNSDWIELGIHGYKHIGDKGSEGSGEEYVDCLRPYEEQHELIEASLKIMEPLIPEYKGFKAPGNHYNSTTLQVLNELGFDYFIHRETFIPLTNISFLGTLGYAPHIQNLRELEMLANEIERYRGKVKYKLISEGIVNHGCK